MSNFKYQYSKTMNAFGVADDRHLIGFIILSPIIIPFAIFWSIVDFVFGTLPDFIFGTEYAHQPTNDEEYIEAARAYLIEYEQERLERIEGIRQDIFGHIN